MNDVLELKVRPRRLSYVERGPWIGRFRANVQEQRAVGPEDARRRRDPRARPLEVVRRRERVVVLVIADAEVVRRRRDDNIDAAGRLLAEDVEAVGVKELRVDDARPNNVERLQQNCHVLFSVRKLAGCSWMTLRQSTAPPAMDRNSTGGVAGRSHHANQDAFVANAIGLTVARRSAAMVWFRRCPWLPQDLPFSSTYETSRLVATSR